MTSWISKRLSSVSGTIKQVRPRRTVRSYVRGRGRLTSGQRKALDDHWRRFGIEFGP